MVTSTKLTIPDIFKLYRERGNLPYGNEAVSQLDHALQCATLATAAGQPPEMIAACLLHDLGHLLHNFDVDATERGIDDRHELRAIPCLQALFSLAVLEPIRLHVQAKRYLCAVDRNYWSTLSDGSKDTLQWQGGIFSEVAAHAFMSQPYAEEAVRLRLWDDQAKVVGLETPELVYFAPMLEACLLS